MRRFLVVSTLLAACTVPLAEAAGSPGDGTLSVKRGRGTVVVKLRGTVIGRVANGRVQVRDFRPFDANDPQLTCRHPRYISAAVTLCRGRNIGFRVDDGRFNVNVRGSGIWISAVGRGSVDVDGAGETGVNDGVLAIDSGQYQSLPDALTTFVLGAAKPAP
jgi:hypothetical protein